jgi:hypothetical protein
MSANQSELTNASKTVGVIFVPNDTKQNSDKVAQLKINMEKRQLDRVVKRNLLVKQKTDSDEKKKLVESERKTVMENINKTYEDIKTLCEMGSLNEIVKAKILFAISKQDLRTLTLLTKELYQNLDYAATLTNLDLVRTMLIDLESLYALQNQLYRLDGKKVRANPSFKLTELDANKVAFAKQLKENGRSQFDFNKLKNQEGIDKLKKMLESKDKLKKVVIRTKPKTAEVVKSV